MSYSFNLDDHITANHLLRAIDHHLDLIELRDHLADNYSSTGRYWVDPKLMLTMLIIGYGAAFVPSDACARRTILTLRVALEDAVSDHSNYSKNHHGCFLESATFRWLFERIACHA